MSEKTTKKEAEEPSADALAEMPDATDSKRFRRKPGRGNHVGLRAGELVRIDPDLLAHFGTAEAVNKALRDVVEAKRRVG